MGMKGISRPIQVKRRKGGPVGSMLVMEGVVSQKFSPIVTYGLTFHLSKACSYRSELNPLNEIIQTLLS
jgi:hypothetical protein